MFLICQVTSKQLKEANMNREEFKKIQQEEFLQKRENCAQALIHEMLSDQPTLLPEKKIVIPAHNHKGTTQNKLIDAKTGLDRKRTGTLSPKRGFLRNAKLLHETRIVDKTKPVQKK